MKTLMNMIWVTGIICFPLVVFLFGVIIVNIVKSAIRNWKHDHRKQEDKEDWLEESDIGHFILYFRINPVKNLHNQYPILSSVLETIWFYLPIYITDRILALQFKGGFCFQFAHMMKASLRRGQVVWLCPFSHWGWQDENGNVYDLCGFIKPKCYMYAIPEDMILDNEVLWTYLHTKHYDSYNQPTEEQYMEVVERYEKANDLHTYNSDLIREWLNKCALSNKLVRISECDFSGYAET